MAKKKARKKAPAKSKKAAKKPAKKSARPAVRRAAKTAAPEGGYQPPKLTGPSVVHWEVQARDPGAQQRFFGDLFGWSVDANNPQNYGMVTPAGPGSIGGGIGGTTDAPRATFYVQVPSIVDTLDRAMTMGAQTVMPRTDIGMVIMAQFRDPEGNLIGLIEGASG
ncbi:MAG TPA: VOC family protein [Polyangia bacterium]|nr:VOC family protein [Polyangia bacterium]